MRLLIVLDDSKAAKLLKQGLSRCGFAVDHATSAQRSSFWVRSTNYDLVIIEHSRANNAVQICQEFRSRGKTMPLIVITQNKPASACSVLEAGADDCIEAECSIEELHARLKAILRRPQQIVFQEIKVGDLTLNTSTYQVLRLGKTITLTRKEFSLLEYLMRHNGITIPRTALIEHVWDVEADLFSNTLETHILNLRRKIEVSGMPKLIHTVSGRGYKIAIEA